MSYVITEACLGTCDTSCVEVCPLDCIHGPLPVDEIKAIKAAGEQAKLANIQLYIDPHTCFECGACESECPVDAIFQSEDLSESLQRYLAINEGFFHNRPRAQGDGAARTCGCDHTRHNK